jgi:hypothetical protein
VEIEASIKFNPTLIPESMGTCSLTDSLIKNRGPWTGCWCIRKRIDIVRCALAVSGRRRSACGLAPVLILFFAQILALIFFDLV